MNLFVFVSAPTGKTFRTAFILSLALLAFFGNVSGAHAQDDDYPASPETGTAMKSDMRRMVIDGQYDDIALRRQLAREEAARALAARINAERRGDVSTPLPPADSDYVTNTNASSGGADAPSGSSSSHFSWVWWVMGAVAVHAWLGPKKKTADTRGSS